MLRGSITKPASSAVLLLAMLAGIEPGHTLVAAEPTQDPLPSWSEGAAKKTIVTFVTRVTTEGGPDFVPPAGAHCHIRQ